ncbi:lysozyme family protein [Bacillus albus]|uniref:lysozyme family protein n=1 Tax=Bacillus TaxID=1386 RepID=UPI002001BADB|nr:MULTISPECIES: lysozyme family protein [Bacillus]MDA2028817.1 lysozyme family protein [Bacillus cereus group sp. Bcc03]MDA2218816.1 lysozyme family protein [Bacillus cereus group sp. Bc228]MDA2230350.1 lysozyme family protein [Bacillus cereus group sp. Bc227]MDA2262896.1 lysozyme family protein [Bacillus cereus group sp. Bc200]MDA2324812.1 lysozyme family protein [Bacillus cereus group sp. Bc177]
MSILAASATTKNLPQQVLRWQSMVESECAAQGVSELVPYVLGIIMVESGGNSETTPDIMQSSESQGWSMNTIKKPKDSIYYGVKHLKGAFDDAKKNGITDLSAIVQSYNFGRAYLRWLASNNKQHSLPVADQYSKTVVAPSLGNTTGAMVKYSNPIAVAYNGGYRYKNGGNFFYSEIVKQYVDFNAGGVPQPEGIGMARSIYWEGYGINYYDGPHGNYLGDFTTAAEVLYWDAYWGEDNDVWLDLGRSRWVKAEHYYWRPFKAISKFPEGYEVSYCDGINGAYKGSINSKEPLTVFFRKEGWIDIGGNSWAPEKHFDIVDIR